MGLGKIGEAWAAKRMPRYAIFREGRRLYEEYCEEKLTPAQKDFSSLAEPDFSEAASDQRLKLAETLYREALELCGQDNAYHDIAVACYQLGLLFHLQGRLHESEAFCMQGLEIADSLPFLNDAEVQLISGCCYHLGILAARNGRKDEAKQLLNRSLRLDESLSDFSGAGLTRKALAQIVGDSNSEGEDSHGGQSF
jgi:tetratricopeptide (TPR) repeat protein